MSALYFAQSIAARNGYAPIYASLGLEAPAPVAVPAVEAPVIPPKPDPVCEACGLPLGPTEERSGWCCSCAYGDVGYA